MINQLANIQCIRHQGHNRQSIDIYCLVLHLNRILVKVLQFKASYPNKIILLILNNRKKLLLMLILIISIIRIS